jgi:hypothetical protein
MAGLPQVLGRKRRRGYFRARLPTKPSPRRVPLGEGLTRNFNNRESASNTSADGYCR